MQVSSWFKVNSGSVLRILLFSCIFIVFSVLVVRNISGPLSGLTGFGPWIELNHDYVDAQEYNGFYFAKNLYFNPFPQLNLIHNQVFYPYGVNNVFNPWSFEADYFYALFYSRFGVGPWLQIYYLLTVLITAIGSFLLLRPDYGSIRAFAVGLLVSFSNFYAIFKYPHHFQESIVHWLTLSIITDFLIVKRVVLRQRISLRFLLLRVGLIFLLLGHDLGYMAGFGLTSFTISMLFIAGLTYRRWTQKEFKFKEAFDREMQAYRQDFFSHPWSCLALIFLAGTAIYLYLPLAFQIAREAKSFDFSGIDFASLWVNPLRIFIPILPGITKPVISYIDELHDLPETSLDGSPGLFLVILGLLGLWQSRKQLVIFTPLLILLALGLLYIPGNLFDPATLTELLLLGMIALALWLTRKRRIIFIPLLLIIMVGILLKPTLFLLPTLKLFPWFTFNRVGGRATVIYPVILGLFALHLRFDQFALRKRRAIAGVLIILACAELATAYSFRNDYWQPTVLKPDFFAYMNYVNKQPGEAVLDWPFCVVSGGGSENICPYYFQGSSVFALRRFHQKKVMGQYFGRLHSSQVAPYFEAGWDKLFFQDEKDPSRQSRCFNQAEWAFFSNFFKLNDFAGINLYVDRLPPACIPEFYQRFGQPAIQTTVPGVGKVVFIPKSPELRKQVNPALGKQLKFQASGS